MSNKSFDGVEVPIGDTATHSIIWLHGLGADGNDFVPVVAELERLGISNCRFIFPHAPVRPVTINAGMEMRAWYDITSLDFTQREEDAEGINASSDLLAGLIGREFQKGINPEKIVVAGFSQGGAIVLHTAVRHPHKLAGVMALSTYLPVAQTVAEEKQAANQQTSFFLAHGVQDDVIAIKYARESKKLLEKEGYPVQWHAYEMSHSLNMEEIQDIALWLKTVLKS